MLRGGVLLIACALHGKPVVRYRMEFDLFAYRIRLIFLFFLLVFLVLSGDVLLWSMLPW